MTLKENRISCCNTGDKEPVGHCIWKEQVYEQMDYKCFINLLSSVF